MGIPLKWFRRRKSRSNAFIYAASNDGKSLMTTPSATDASTMPGHLAGLRERLVRGSAILLCSTGLVAATNLLYNIWIARRLGAAGFGNASALYTLLMLLSAITLSFQIVTSKFIARSSETPMRAQIYARMLRRAWQAGLVVAVLIAAGGTYLKSYSICRRCMICGYWQSRPESIYRSVYVAERCKAVMTFADWRSMSS